ncbi:MAG: GNAT family N-acetyltransferase [Chitinophagaceae bacterium]
MITYSRATAQHANAIAQLGKETFRDSHKDSTTKENLDYFLNKNYDIDFITKQLEDPKQLFHVAMYNDNVIAYSKIILNTKSILMQKEHIAYLEKLYVSANFYGQKIGYSLFEINKKLAMQEHQLGFWLNVWVGNERAIRFYEKLGFKKIGDTLFNITPTHANPNYQMMIAF